MSQVCNICFLNDRASRSKQTREYDLKTNQLRSEKFIFSALKLFKLSQNMQNRI